MKKFASLLVAVIMCLSMGQTAFAAAPEDELDEEESFAEVELNIPEGDPEFSIIPEANDPLAEDMVLDGDDEISPRIIPSTANDFRILNCYVYPMVVHGGVNEYISNANISFTPKSFAPTTIRETVTKEKQAALIGYAEDRGEEVVGWYIKGTFRMDCYLPHYVEYRIFSRDKNGEELKARSVSKGTKTCVLDYYFLFPEDMTKDYTYGFEGNGVMQVYDKAANTIHDLYPDYVMKVTFKAN